MCGQRGFVSCDGSIELVQIYRKPTYTDAIIPADSCHPMEQRLAEIRYFYNMLNQYHLSPINLEKEITSSYKSCITTAMNLNHQKLYKKRKKIWC